ncbi:hypothetical protein FRC14_006755 [Serendipita sp. 396]|nr:hypothetical protein FRC14_006755 [Serendipita sp. 396]KAG8782535.1 hypothetical protein FRC15_006833 [Serendipita sp. 397]KAG8844861.1 hypothetical protein FRC20_003367 [Serendipita sp. 405]
MAPNKSHLYDVAVVPPQVDYVTLDITVDGAIYVHLPVFLTFIHFSYTTTTRSMSSKADEIVDKQGEPIEIGDEVATKMRGGKRTGIVSDIVASEEDADKKGVKNPPKVLFEDQHGEYQHERPSSWILADVRGRRLIDSG